MNLSHEFIQANPSQKHFFTQNAINLIEEITRLSVASIDGLMGKGYSKRNPDYLAGFSGLIIRNISTQEQSDAIHELSVALKHISGSLDLISIKIGESNLNEPAWQISDKFSDVAENLDFIAAKFNPLDEAPTLSTLTKEQAFSALKAAFLRVCPAYTDEECQSAISEMAESLDCIAAKFNTVDDAPTLSTLTKEQAFSALKAAFLRVRPAYTNEEYQAAIREFEQLVGL